MKKHFKIFTLLALALISGLTSCTDPKIHVPNDKPIVDLCHDSTLIGVSSNKGAWMYNDPVCGCDGQTYMNKDIARYENGVISYTPGPCDKKKKHKHNCDKKCHHKDKEDDCFDPDLIGSVMFCRAPDYNPVCGCDNVTYYSPEEATYTYGVKNYTFGPCHKDTTYIDECIDTAKINYAVDCLAIYQPVCGCNGVTYSNSCDAMAAGVKSFTNGPCYTILPLDSTIYLYDEVK